MVKQIWFGIPGVKMQWCPAPKAGAQVSNNGYVQTVAFENGGADVVRSAQTRKQYTFNFAGPSKDLDGISTYSRYAAGFYGSGLIYFADPYSFETNLFPAGWSSPGLIEQGWENIYDTTPTFANTPSNSYNQPLRYPTWSITAAEDAAPVNANSSIYIPIPPGYRLGIGASGYSTGSAKMFVERIAPGGSVSLTKGSIINPTSSTRMNVFVDGDSFEAVRIYFARDTSSTSTVSVVSMMAQVYKVSGAYVAPTSHILGEGHTGLSFADEARVENYTYIDPPRKGMNTTLVEVGAWR